MAKARTGYGGHASLRGRPPDDHPRRCHGIMRDGERCTQWALKGLTRCSSHGGSKSKRCQYRNGEWNKFMPNFYRKQLTKSLTAAVSEQLQLETNEQFSIIEELALMRETCADYVQMYAIAHQAYEDAPSEDLLECKISAGTLMREALSEVVTLAEKASKIHFTTKNVFTALDLKLVVAQLVKIQYEVCGQKYKHIAEEFEYSILEKLTLPSDEQGTTLTPDQDVQAMDSTVPLYVESDEHHNGNGHPKPSDNS